MIKKNFILATILLFNINTYCQDIINWESLVNAEFLWHYSLGDDSIPSNWNDLSYNDDSWTEGIGGFGYNDSDDGTIIFQTPSVYIRHIFNISSSTEIENLILYMDYDDGFIAYLNGTEIARGNMNNAGDQPAFNVFSDNCNHEANLYRGALPDKFILSEEQIMTNLKDGENCLSIEIHNCSSTSTDMSSSAWLIASVRSNSLQYSETPDWFVIPPDGSSDLPLIVIETSNITIPDEPKIDAYMKVIDNGEGMINHINDEATDYSGLIGIEARGQSSLGFPKYSYTIETRDSLLKDDLKISLLGMPKESDWVLHAPYSDKTLMRNALTYYLGQQMGNWAPRFRYCEVYLNGDYMGIYLLMEKIKRDGDRVDIKKTKPTHNAGDSLTGGYIIRVDKIGDLSEGTDYFYSAPSYSYPNSRNCPFTYYYPEAEKITVQQKNYIQNFINVQESALNSPSFKDPNFGYAKYMDINSFIDFQIMQELGNNVDGYRYSTYFYKNADSKDSKLHAGPLWDFNLCYGNVDYSDSNYSTTAWEYNLSGTIHWWTRLMEDSNYYSLLRKRYSLLRDNKFNNENILNFIDESAALLDNSIDKNFTRWPILGNYVWPNKFIGNSYEEEINFFSTWLINRLNFMDSQWYYKVGINQNEFSSNTGINVFPNPFTESIYINLETDNYTPHQVFIYDLTGKLVHESTLSDSDQLDLPFLEKGIYILKISGENDQWYTKKLIKQ